MIPIVDKLLQAARRHRARPPLELLRKVQRSVGALAMAQIHLRRCTSVGAHPRTFGGKPDVSNDGILRIGNDFSMSCTFGTVQLQVGKAGALIVGDDVSINYGTAISARSKVQIGSSTKIGPYCVVADSDLPLPLDAGGEGSAPVIIGKNVWLGGRVVVMPGTVIGDGAVVSAGSVVSGVIPPNAVASGIPARVLRITAGPPVSGARLRLEKREGEIVANAEASRAAAALR